jgi:hypothetical protein
MAEVVRHFKKVGIYVIVNDQVLDVTNVSTCLRYSMIFID